MRAGEPILQDATRLGRLLDVRQGVTLSRGPYRLQGGRMGGLDATIKDLVGWWV